MKQAARVSCWVLLVGLVLAVGAFAQGQSQQVRTGFVVITPKSPATGQNIVVSSTFGNRSSCGAMQAGVPAVGLSKSGLIPISSNTTLNRDLGVAIVNLNDTPATVEFTLRDINGAAVASLPDVEIPPMSHMALFVRELFEDNSAATRALKDFLGTLTYESDMPIAVVGLRFQGSNFSTVPAITTSETTFDVPRLGEGIGGPGAVVLPQFAVGQGWNTQIAITNSSGVQPQFFRVDLFDQNGRPLSINLNGETGSSFQDLEAAVNSSLFLTTDPSAF